MIKINQKLNHRQRKRFLFFLCLVIVPCLQVSIFYVYVNFNSFILAFRKFEISGAEYTVSFAKFENFKSAWELFTDNTYMIANSLILYLFATLLGLTLATIFSFYIYKKYVLSKLFRIILFMPQIISSIVFATLFRYIVTDVYKIIAERITGTTVLEGLLDNLSTKFGTILFYNLWIGFGINVLLFSGSMSGINESVVESAKIEGANIAQEFIFITIPMIWRTLVTFLIVGVTGIFTNQMNLFSLYGTGGMDVASFGYYLYVMAQASDIIAPSGVPSYSVLSALGLIITMIVLPITLILRKMLFKFGPKED